MKNMNTHRLTTILYVLLTALTAAAQSDNSVERMQREIKAFLSTEGVTNKTVHDGQGLYQHIFKITCEGGSGKKPHKALDAMEKVDKTFTDTYYTATSAFSYNAGNYSTPFGFIRFTWPNSYMRYVMFRYGLGNKVNYRFATYTDKDSTRHCFGLVWNPVEFIDKDGRPYKSIDGYIIELHGNHWSYKIEEFTHNDDDENTPQENGNTDAITAADTLGYVKLREKLSSLSKLFAKAKKADDNEQMDALAYVAHKVGTEYKGKLTFKQFHPLSDNLKAMDEMTDNPDQKRLLYDTMQALEKIVADRKYDEQHSFCITETFSSYSDITPIEEERWTLFKEYDWKDSQTGPLYKCEISGRSMTPNSFMVVKSIPLYASNYRMRAKEGRFSMKCNMHLGQFAVVMDNSTERYWWLIADSVPVNINMADGTAECSDINKRFLQYQKRIATMAKELCKYKINMPYESGILDQAGYNAIIDSIEVIQWEAIKDNPDNLISTFFLTTGYQNMPYKQLEEVMKKGEIYTEQVTMQPVWKHFEGMKKRLPGQKYTDLTLTGTDGNLHKLSQYVGKGNYVLLHFWSTWAWWSRRELKYIKDITTENKDKPLTVIGISINQDQQDWKEYVKARNLNWTHLSDSDGWNGEAAKAYGVTMLPTSILIAPDGTIVEQGLRNATLQEKIRELMQTQ